MDRVITGARPAGPADLRGVRIGLVSDVKGTYGG
jgi:hypothetical protein